MNNNMFCQSDWYHIDHKPLEIYMFIDPLCAECWALEPIMKKLHIEYGAYFRLKHVLSGQLTTLNLGAKKQSKIAKIWEMTAIRSGMSCDGSFWQKRPLSSPVLTSISIKAAELQGKRAGIKFLRKLQELLFLEKENISDLHVLKNAAAIVGLDVEEFLKDLHSKSACKAFQCDLKIAAEMDVTEMPTLVFFNENIEDEGLKITGMYTYDIYVQIISEMLDKKPEPSSIPPLEQFLRHYKLVASKEISVVYEMPISQVEKEMKKWILQQKVEKIPAKYGTFWRYIGED